MKKNILIFLLFIISAVLVVKLVNFYQNPKTVILDKKIFDNDINGNDKASLEVNNINTISSNKIEFYKDWIDDNTFLVNTKAGLKSVNDDVDASYEYYLYNINNKNMTSVPLKGAYVDNQNLISPDKQKILYIKNGIEATPSVVYDISKQKECSQIARCIAQCWMPDSSGFVLLTKNGNLQLADIQKNTTTTLLNVNKLNINIYMSELKVSRDGSTVFILPHLYSYDNTHNIIYVININDKSNVETKKIEITQLKIYQYVIVNKDSLLFLGMQGKKRGVYIYNIRTGKTDCLIEGYVYQIAISEDNSKIAYIVNSNNKDDNVCVAKFSNNRIISPSTIFSGNVIYDPLKWNSSGDKLMFVECITDKSDNKLHIVNFK